MLGLNENTARMRVERALEKLRARLARKGVTSASAALTGMLTENALNATPAPFVAALIKASLGAAAPSIAASSILEFPTLMLSTKLSVTVAALVVLALGVAVTVKLRKPAGFPERSRTASVTQEPPETNAGTALQKTPDPATAQAEADRLAAGLELVRAALHEAGRTETYPQPAMQRALAALRGDAKAALPLLREALNDADQQVRTRAVYGLISMRPDAGEAAPDLIQMAARSRSVEETSLAFAALESMRPSSDFIPDLVKVLKGKWDWAPDFMVESLFRMFGKFGVMDPETNERMAGCLRPMLEDQNKRVQQIGAYSLARLLRNEAGPEILSVALQGLGYPEGSWMNSRGMALSALRFIGTDPEAPIGFPFALSDATSPVRLANLGDSVNGAVDALVEIANNSELRAERLNALELLDAIQPGRRAETPVMDQLLTEQEQDRGYLDRLVRGQLSLSELMDGIAAHPSAISSTVSLLGKMGPAAFAALPALHEVFAALEPQPEMSWDDRNQATASREAIADALQKIAPDQSKLLFTGQDLGTIINNSTQQDTTKRLPVLNALNSAMRDVQNTPEGTGHTPDAIRRWLSAVSEVDSNLPNIMLTEVKRIDPHFSLKPQP